MSKSNGRDSKTGRFLPGNPGGPGNPRLPKLQKLKQAMDEATDPDVIKAIWRKCQQLALAGDIRAIKYVLDRTFGKPKQHVELEGDMNHTVATVQAGIERLATSLQRGGVEIDFSQN